MGIGTLSEKSVHRELKNLYGCLEQQEIRIGKYIADVMVDNHIYEIQTKNFKALTDKINYYIKNGYKITVVHPIVVNKINYWLDKVTDEIIEKKKSTYHQSKTDAIYEIYWILYLLRKKLVNIEIISIEMNEYKYLDGYGKYNKNKATKIDKEINRIVDKIVINNVKDLRQLLPNISSRFTADEFIKESKLKGRHGGSCIKTLRDAGIIKIVGKQGQAYLYEIVEEK